MVIKGEGGWARDKSGVWDEQIHTTVYKIDNNKVLLYSIVNYIQYLVITCMGKESEKEIFVSIYLYI